MAKNLLPNFPIFNYEIFVSSKSLSNPERHGSKLQNEWSYIFVAQVVPEISSF